MPRKPKAAAPTPSGEPEVLTLDEPAPAAAAAITPPPAAAPARDAASAPAKTRKDGSFADLDGVADRLKREDSRELPIATLLRDCWHQDGEVSPDQVTAAMRLLARDARFSLHAREGVYRAKLALMSPKAPPVVRSAAYQAGQAANAAGKDMFDNPYAGGDESTTLSASQWEDGWIAAENAKPPAGEEPIAAATLPPGPVLVPPVGSKDGGIITAIDLAGHGMLIQDPVFDPIIGPKAGAEDELDDTPVPDDFDAVPDEDGATQPQTQPEGGDDEAGDPTLAKLLAKVDEVLAKTERTADPHAPTVTVHIKPPPNERAEEPIDCRPGWIIADSAVPKDMESVVRGACAAFEGLLRSLVRAASVPCVVPLSSESAARLGEPTPTAALANLAPVAKASMRDAQRTQRAKAEALPPADLGIPPADLPAAELVIAEDHGTVLMPVFQGGVPYALVREGLPDGFGELRKLVTPVAWARDNELEHGAAKTSAAAVARDLKLERAGRFAGLVISAKGRTWVVGSINDAFYVRIG